ncbi:hypothetical protein [Candidatus Phaeomarinobacter ectocarpi]|nr:hypothetical protein [Candidatus Phaeomarinobacter ectocarpi]
MSGSPESDLDEALEYIRRLSTHLEQLVLHIYHAGKTAGAAEARAESASAIQKEMQLALERVLAGQTVDGATAEVVDRADLSASTPPKRAKRGATKNAILEVFDLFDHPERGRSPSELRDKMASLGMPSVTATTVRTTLHRLKDSDQVEKRGSLWFKMREGPAEARPSSSNVGPVTGRGKGFPPSAPEGSIPSGSTATPDDDQSSGSDDQEAWNDMLS